MIEAQILEYMTQHVGPMWMIFSLYISRFISQEQDGFTLLPELGSNLYSLDETKNAKAVLEPQKTYKICLSKH